MHKLNGEEVLGASTCQTQKFKEDETKIKVKKRFLFKYFGFLLISRTNMFDLEGVSS